MANTDFAQLAGAGDMNRAGLIQALEKRALYVITADEDPEDLTPGYATHLAFNGVVFFYDADDATTPHDGTTCLVTADGKRFKADALAGAQRRHWLVQDKDLTAPPVSPTLGHCYIVAVGATGDWAGEDKHIAVSTARGWRFIVPAAFDIATVSDETLIYHYSAGGAWASGIGALTIGADSVLPSAIKYARWGLSVVNKTTNAPPGSPADGDAYIIGGSPTGAWSGKARQIAIYQSSAWVYYVPTKGDTAFDKTTNAAFVFDGSAWVSLQSGYAQVTHIATDATATLTTSGTVGSSTDYDFSPSTSPTTGAGNVADAAKLTYTAKASGKVLEVEYEAVVSTSDANISALTFALQIDSAVSMSDHMTQSVTAAGALHLIRAKFYVTTTDTSSHDYTVRVFPTVNTNIVTRTINLARRRLQISERS